MYRGDGFTPSALTVSVIEVLHSSMLKGSMRQYHTFHGECMAMAKWELYTLQSAPCTIFPFDIRLIANQTVNSRGLGYLIYRFTESMYSYQPGLECLCAMKCYSLYGLTVNQSSSSVVISPLIMSVVHHHIIKHVDRYASIAPPPSLEHMLSVEHRYLHACTNSGFHGNEVKSTCTEDDEGGVSNTNTFF